MRKSKFVLTPVVFVVAFGMSLLAALAAVSTIETLSKSGVERALLLEGQEWAQVETTGLQVILSGTAPDETTRFKALSIAGGVVDSGRVIDEMDVPPAQAITPPRFSIEILRNEGGVSMIGLVPAAVDRAALSEKLAKIAAETDVTDLMETADYPVPERWTEAVDYAIAALAMLPRAKISMNAERIEIEAVADSPEQKRLWERNLARMAPGGMRVALDISAPRPVVTPFTLRFTIDQAGARFDACTAHTEQGRVKIVSAGISAGVKGRPDCTIGLGVPSPQWPDAVARGIRALSELGGGSLTFSDADVTLIAAADTPQALFDRVIGELEADLPDVFSLHAVLPEPVSISGTGESDGPPEFVATLSSEGRVQLRGRVADEQERAITESFARAHFGVENVYAAMRIDPTLPRGWSVRTLAAVEALSHLANGTAVVQPDVVDLNGVTGEKNASAEISRILSEKLGEAQDFRVNVTYEERFDPIAALPTPEECVASINAAMAKGKITFPPGSTDIEASSAATIDEIAGILKGCPDVAMEIGGYTDSQGREEMNKALSQRRADAVVTALLARRVLTSGLTSHGYGEENPIADNETEEGREANRRIEFRLIGAADEVAAATTTPDDTPTEGEVGEDGEEIDGNSGDGDSDGGQDQPEDGAAPQAVVDAPVVVDPELAGIRPKPRPNRDDDTGNDD
jgi:OOP family OmpA-OmpF porin